MLRGVGREASHVLIKCRELLRVLEFPRALHHEFRGALDDREDLEKAIGEHAEVEPHGEVGRALHFSDAKFHGGGDTVKGIGLKRSDEASGEPVRDPVIEFGGIDGVRLEALERLLSRLALKRESFREGLGACLHALREVREDVIHGLFAREGKQRHALRVPPESNQIGRAERRSSHAQKRRVRRRTGGACRREGRS